MRSNESRKRTLVDDLTISLMQERRQTVDLLCEEPFRVFFPVGLLLGAIGVLLWILYYAGIISFYPGVSHARLMIEGFVASFVIGFLGTAGPRLMETQHLSRLEVLILLTLDLLAAGFQLGGANRAGDATFSLCAAFFLIVLARRFAHRQDSPPPHFAVVALSLVNALTGAALLALCEDKAYSASYQVGGAFLHEGFPLLAILAVAPFMLPLLLNLSAIEDLRPTSGGTRTMQASLALAVGLTIDATFVLGASGLTSIAAWLRVTAMFLYLAAQMPWHGRSFLGNCLRVGLAAMALGFLAEALWPQLRIGALHIVFITGFAFVILTVATRVTLGHSGNAYLFRRRLPFHLVVATFLALAMFSRVTADQAPRARAIHLVAAAILWLAAIIVWAVRLLPQLQSFEAEE